jgi:aryl-alcohol dehydrogenase-like predicted oxidoreductase
VDTQYDDSSSRRGATPRGTSRFRDTHGERVAAEHFRSSETGLIMSSIGLGTYLGDQDDDTDTLYAHALSVALARGCNVIDAAINYRCQRSERVIGRALHRLTSDGTARRDEIVLATKGGYLPFDGHVPSDPQGYLGSTYLDSGIIDRRDLVAGCHCIAPSFLRDQLDRSLENLKVDRIDVYFIHNPETQLQENDRAEFQRRIQAAFEFLEMEADADRIGYYGVATWNGLRRSKQARDHLSLAELVRTAERIRGSSHRFRFIQAPYNLAMTEAHTEQTQSVGGRRMSTLEAARGFGITVVASASLLQGQLLHLPRGLSAAFPTLASDAQRALQFVRSTPGVTTALVGMKTERHVVENLAVANVAPDPAAVQALLAPAAPGPDRS